MKNALRAFGYFKADAPLIALVAGLILAGAALNALKPWPFSLLVDCAFGSRPVPAWLAALPGGGSRGGVITWLAVLMFALHTGQGAVASLYTYFSIQAGLRGLGRVRDEVMGKMMRLSLRFYHGSRTGDLIYRATWDTYAFQTFFQQGLVTFLSSQVSLVLMLGVMTRLDLHLTLVALGVAPALFFVIRRFGGQMSERTREAQQADSTVASSVQQNLNALQLIQSHTQEAGEMERFRRKTEAAREGRVRQHRVEVVYGLAVTAVFAAGTSLIVWRGAGEVEAGRLTLGQLMVFIAYLAQLYEPLNQLSHVGTTIAGAGAGMARVFEILDSTDEIVSPARASGSAPATESPESGFRAEASGILRFSGVHFSYQEGREVLRGIDLEIRPGETVALIGPSGAGKTTLLNLVPRFFEPSSGGVFLDGRDLRTLDLADLRGRVALVLQEPALLPATIAENIAYGRPAASIDEIKAAARAAHADAFIRQLPSGYETVVGEGAARLSSGEKQRINLARAFLKNAPILLLDEPTSALDRESEELVLRGLEELMRGRTTIMVAHRLATIRSASRIVALDGGRVVESGSHEELTRRGGYYARLQDRVVGQAPEISD